MGRRRHYFDHLDIELADTSRLTARRAAVLRMAARGHTAQEIANELGVTIDTVSSHLDALKDQFCAMNRADMISQAWMHGVLEARRMTAALVIGLCLLASMPTARVNARTPSTGRPRVAQMTRVGRIEIAGVAA